jgi:uracil-DNA glycosylase
VVFGNGNADADLMFVGEAPGFHEDQQGLPFVGRAGNLLSELLEGIGLTRDEVFVANVLKCLRYNAQVQLGDGTWERIERLVRSRYSGDVMSVDAAGNLVRRRVTGWHATPVGDRSVYRLTYRSAKRAGSNRVGVELTGDHPVLTERGYLPVEQLRPDDRIATGQGLSPLAEDDVPAHRALGVLRRDFYRPRKTVPSWVADSLSERMLAIWFMDDSYTRIRPGGRRPLAEIATVPPSMRYKLHPDVAARVRFRPSWLRPELQRVLYDETDIENVTHRHRPDQTFFCIDVEGTHNFVTAGGVVHNCRPPGNRDPQPDEIDTCKPYLFKQVELIEPRVVCTLGNFATKLLTRSNRGITSVRGQPQVHELGARWVRIYPILHPAAALRTPRVREQLEEDFARLPALLAESPSLPPGVVQAPAAAQPEPAASQLDLFG